MSISPQLRAVSHDRPPINTHGTPIEEAQPCRVFNPIALVVTGLRDRLPMVCGVQRLKVEPVYRINLLYAANLCIACWRFLWEI